MKIRRILVGLDSSSHSRGALETAASIASRLHAELVGVFVEDINLLRLGQLPCAREVGYASATRRIPTASEMERRLKRLAEESRRTLEVAAGRANVPCSFQVSRGAVTLKLLEAAMEADLLALGTVGGEVSASIRLGSTARSMISDAPRTVLLWSKGPLSGGPALVLCDGSEPALEAIPTALHLAQALGGECEVVTLAANVDEANERETRLVKELKNAGQAVPQLSRVVGVSPGRLGRLAQSNGAGAVILAGSNPFPSEQELQAFAETIRCPLFLVR